MKLCFDTTFLIDLQKERGAGRAHTFLGAHREANFFWSAIVAGEFAQACGAIEDLPGLGFRTIVDPEGDLATHLVITFPSAEIAQAVATELGSITLAASGWHVYSNMEHLLERRTADGLRLSAWWLPRCLTVH